MKCNAANRMGTDMGYRDDFYVAQNIVGYTGDIGENPTVYFSSDKQHGNVHGRITQDHKNKDNIGRDVVKTNEGYSIWNETDDEGKARTVEYQKDMDHPAFDKRHRSRGELVLIDATTTAADRALLSQSIWRYTELKTNRRRNSV
jgi:hypothetical protein